MKDLTYHFYGIHYYLFSSAQRSLKRSVYFVVKGGDIGPHLVVLRSDVVVL